MLGSLQSSNEHNELTCIGAKYCLQFFAAEVGVKPIEGTGQKALNDNITNETEHANIYSLFGVCVW